MPKPSPEARADHERLLAELTRQLGVPVNEFTAAAARDFAGVSAMPDSAFATTPAGQFKRALWVVLQQARAATDTLARSVVPIFRTLPSGDPDHEGTGLLVTLNGKYYLASAAHVFDACLHGIELLEPGLDGASLSDEVHATRPPAGKSRSEDRLDLGVLPLTETEATAIGRSRFLSLELATADPPPEATVLVLALGYPSRDQVHEPATPATHTALAMLMLGEAEDRAYNAVGVKRETHLLLGFRKQVMLTNGRRGSPTHPRGMSGGGVWSLPLAQDGEPVSGPRLLAVLTERPPEFGPSLLATRVSVLRFFIEFNRL